MTDNITNDMTAGCPICAWTSDNPDHLFLFETAFWRIVLAPNQALLGRCIAGHFRSGLTPRRVGAEEVGWGVMATVVLAALIA